MGVILDTAEIARPDRPGAIYAAMRSATPLCDVVCEPGDDIYARIDRWQFGKTVVRRDECSGIRMIRTDAHTHNAAPEIVAIGLQEHGRAHHAQFGHTRIVEPGELIVSDLSAPYDYGWLGRGAAVTLRIPHDQLALPAGTVRRAAGRLLSSRLYGLVHDHIVRLRRDADLLSLDPTAAAVGAASIELGRALLASAAGADPVARSVLAETVLTRVRWYVRQHLSEPDLHADRIAAEHNISVRQLYRLCREADFSLEQWIISQRLEGARDELASPAGRHRSIAMIARRWGFSDATHFSRRFRAAYGVPPRDWRRIATETPADPPRRS